MPDQRHIPETVILGAGGMLATVWAETMGSGLRHARLGPVAFLTAAECDITNPGDLARAIAPGVRVVINCAAYTAVDQAESEEARATEINGAAVGLIAARCREVGATLVHYSTDYVFDGSATSPYRVDAPRNPVGAYGRSKTVGEELLERSGADFLNLRTAWLYAHCGSNFVRTIAKAARERPALRVVNDQRGMPTSCATLVDITLRLLAADARGTLHACNSGECTWFDLASAIVERVNAATGASCAVEPCASSEYPRPAKRPAYSVLDLGPTEALIGPITPWRDALRPVLDRILTPQPSNA